MKQGKLKAFFASDAAGGVVLMVSAALAMLAANGPLATTYTVFQEKTLLVINDLLMEAIETACTGRDPVAVMEEAVRNVTPALEVKSRRVGGATYQVPIEVPARRGRTLAIRWLVRFARERREKQMSERLANELLDALGSQGGAFKRKDDLYRMAQANKAFAHYRW